MKNHKQMDRETYKQSGMQEAQDPRTQGNAFSISKDSSPLTEPSQLKFDHLLARINPPNHTTHPSPPT